MTLLKFRRYPRPLDTIFVARLSYFLPSRNSANNPPTAHALRTQRKRLAAINKISDLTKAGQTQSAAAAAAGMSLTTAWRLRRAFTIGGAAALLPKVITGRPGKPQPRISERSRSKAECLALLKRSAKAGWIAFAETSDCPADLAKFIRSNRASLPAAMLRAVRLRRVSSKMTVGPTQIAIWARDRELGGSK